MEVHNNSSKHSEVIFNFILFLLFSTTFIKENIHLISWFKSTCSQIGVFFPKIHVKTSLLESFFNNVAGFNAWNFIQRRLWHRYLPVNFPQFLKKPYLQKITGWLLLLIPPLQPKFYPVSHVVGFFLHFFLLFFIIAIMEFTQKISKNEDFFTFFNNLFKN